MTKHKHHKEIVAWANGETIECRHKNGYGWITFAIAEQPLWKKNLEYRVKPEIKPNIVLPACASICSSGNSGLTYLYVWETLSLQNVEFTFNSETKELIAVELIK